MDFQVCLITICRITPNKTLPLSTTEDMRYLIDKAVGHEAKSGHVLKVGDRCLWRLSLYIFPLTPNALYKVKMLFAQSCPVLCNPLKCTLLSIEFSRQEYWSGRPFPSPGDCPNLKQESSRKTSISALLTMPKALTVWITINCGKF